MDEIRRRRARKLLRVTRLPASRPGGARPGRLWLRLRFRRRLQGRPRRRPHRPGLVLHPGRAGPSAGLKLLELDLAIAFDEWHHQPPGHVGCGRRGFRPLGVAAAGIALIPCAGGAGQLVSRPGWRNATANGSHGSKARRDRKAKRCDTDVAGRVFRASARDCSQETANKRHSKRRGPVLSRAGAGCGCRLSASCYNATTLERGKGGRTSARRAAGASWRSGRRAALVGRAVGRGAAAA